MLLHLAHGDRRKANEDFFIACLSPDGLGILFTVIGEIFVMNRFRGFWELDAAMLPYCVTYGRILMLALIPFMLQNVFQSFLVTAERPQLGLCTTWFPELPTLFGCSVYCSFRWGVAGAASATAISQTVGGIVPLVFFIVFQKKQTSSGKNTYGSSGNNKSMYQWIFRIYDKRISLHCKYAV